jgi:rod shape-determining protein MreC
VLKFKKKNLISFFLLCAFILVFSLLTPSLRKPFLTILEFPLNLLTVTSREIGAIVFYHRNFTQVERLTKQLDFLKQKLINLDELKLENERLKKAFAFEQQSSFKVISARVIGRALDSWSSIAIIDKGALHGIKRGMIAINYLGLVGRVIETADSTSKILLINDPNFGVSAIVQRSRQEGLVSGTLGSHLIMKYLPQDSDIRINDKIITSGLNNVCPKGILIGTVADIGREFSGLSHYAMIKPAVNPSSVEEMLIIIP